MLTLVCVCFFFTSRCFFLKMRILYLSQRGHRPPTIARILQEEGMTSSRKGNYSELQYRSTRTIAWRPKSGRSIKVTEEVKRVVSSTVRFCAVLRVLASLATLCSPKETVTTLFKPYIRPIILKPQTVNKTER